MENWAGPIRTGFKKEQHNTVFIFRKNRFFLENEVVEENASGEGETVNQTNGIRVYKSLVLIFLVVFLSFLYYQFQSLIDLKDNLE